MPSAHSILWFLAAFVAMWAVSLIWRGVRGDRSAGRRCPSCLKPVSAGAKACGGCGFEATRDWDWLAARRSWRMVLGGLALLPCAAGAAVGGRIVWGWFQPGDEFALSMSVWTSAAVATAVFSLVLMGWAIRGDRSRGRRRCPACWYDMTGAGLRCPECGREATHVKDLYRPRRHWKRAAFASLLLLAAACMPGVPRYQRGGWRALIPTTVLIAGFEWLPDEAISRPNPNLEEDWTLYGRERRERWEWQNLWFDSKVEAAIAESDDLRVLRRAFEVSDNADIPTPRVAARVASRLAAACTEGSAAEYAVAEGLVATFTVWSRFGHHPEVRASLLRYAPRLRAVIEDSSTPPGRIEACAALLASTDEGLEAVLPTVLDMVITQGGFGNRQSWVFILKHAADGSPVVKRGLIARFDDPIWPLAELCILAAAYGRSRDAAVEAELLRIVRTGVHPARVELAARKLMHGDPDLEPAINAVLNRVETPGAAGAPLLASLLYQPSAMYAHLPRLISLAESSDPAVRVELLELFYSMAQWDPGLSGTLAYPTIMDLANDSDPAVAASARRVLEYIPMIENSLIKDPLSR